jgi:hypothetical protein
MERFWPDMTVTLLNPTPVKGTPSSTWFGNGGATVRSSPIYFSVSIPPKMRDLAPVPLPNRRLKALELIKQPLARA